MFRSPNQTFSASSTWLGKRPLNCVACLLCLCPTKPPGPIFPESVKR
jgi:hypothetical protein